MVDEVVGAEEAEAEALVEDDLSVLVSLHSAV